MARMILPFAYQSYLARSPQASSQRCLNFYPESNVKSEKTPIVLYGTPGLKEFSSQITLAPSFGLYRLNNALYLFAGNNVYTINNLGQETLIGNIGTVDDKLDISDNGTQITVIKGNGQGYVIEGNVITKITDPDFPASSSTAFVNGFTLVSEANSGRFYWSAINDSLSWNALDFATAEADSDNLVRVFVKNREVWLLGERSTEVFYQTGDINVPFRRVQNGVIERGCAAKFSVAENDDGLFWLGDDLKVFYARGYQPQVISTPALEYQISTYDIISDAESFVYTQEGHEFYVLTFPTAKKTWVYDLSTGIWHERDTYLKGRWRARDFVFIFGKFLVTDFERGIIYEMDMDTYKDVDDPIVRIVQTPSLFDMENVLTHNTVNIEFQSGVGLNDGQGRDPQAMLEYSDDGGFSYSSQRFRPIGKIGRYKNKAVWRNLGTSSDRIYRITLSDPVKAVIINAYADVQKGYADG